MVKAQLNEVINIKIQNHNIIIKDKKAGITIEDKAMKKLKVLVNESELSRILKAINPLNKLKDGGTYPFVRDLIIIKIGKSTKKYEQIKGDGILYINDIAYKRVICASGHNRAKKILLIRESLFNIVNKILLCGIKEDEKFKPSKLNSYYGLAATDSVPVKMPNIVVVDDYKRIINEKFDVVHGNIDKKEYRVESDVEMFFEILPFDGAGLVDISRAEQWKNELELDYIPSSWQFRAIPGIKGNLYTADLKKFAELHEDATTIKDVWGKEWDFKNDNIDCILTLSQVKFKKLYTSYEQWITEFNKEVVYEFEGKVYKYNRTFNIASVSVPFNKLKNTVMLAYQPLQTLNLDKPEIETLCKDTVKLIKDVHSNVDSFIAYRGLVDDKDEVDDTIPPYYRALKTNHSLANDSYLNTKISHDLESMKTRSYVGKIAVSGNYQTLTPDILGLAQYAFGLEVIGLLSANTIYSNYWNSKKVKEVDIIRNPHIANEHCVVKVVKNGGDGFYKFQDVGIVTSMYDSICMKANSADYDGDTIATVSSKVILDACKKNVARTILPMIDSPDENCSTQKTNTTDETEINNISKLIDTDIIGMKSDIGNVINKISTLWSISNLSADDITNNNPNVKDAPSVQDSIKIMSVIGSLVIDFVKTGKKADIPTNILDLIKPYNKPMFMKYLNKKAFSADKKIRKNAEVYGVSDEVLESKIKFSDIDCTMNRVCNYMIEQVGDLKPTFIGKSGKNAFDFSRLYHTKVNCYNVTSKRVKQKLLELQELHNEITNDKYHDICDDSDQRRENAYRYKWFYSYAREELLLICGNVNRLLDYVLYVYYVDKDFISKYNDKAILWNSFADEMIKRSNDDFSVINIDDEMRLQLLERQKKNLEKIEKAKDSYRKVKMFLFEKDPSAVNITKNEITAIKKKIKGNTEAQRLFFTLLVMARKLTINALNVEEANKKEKLSENNLGAKINKNKKEPVDKKKKLKPIRIYKGVKNQINYSQINKLADINGRKFNKLIQELAKLEMVHIDTNNLENPKITVLFDNIGGEIKYSIKDINEVCTCINRSFPYVKKGKVQEKTACNL